MSAQSSASPWIALAGVVVGFLLGEGSRYIRYRWEIGRNRRIILTELETILAQLPQKRDILHQAIASLRKQRFMPTLTVRCVSTGYRAVIDDLCPHLSLEEPNCLHVIYERLRVADDQMDSFEENFLKAVKDKVIEDPWSTFAGRIEELLESFEVVEQLARSYVRKKPIDVFSE